MGFGARGRDMVLDGYPPSDGHSSVRFEGKETEFFINNKNQTERFMNSQVFKPNRLWTLKYLKQTVYELSSI